MSSPPPPSAALCRRPLRASTRHLSAPLSPYPSARQSHLKATLGGPRASQHCSPMSSSPPPAVPPPSVPLNSPSQHRAAATAPLSHVLTLLPLLCCTAALCAALHSPSQRPATAAPLSHFLPTSLCCTTPLPSTIRHLNAPPPPPHSPMSSSPPPSAALRRCPLCTPPLPISAPCCCCRPTLPCPPHLLPLLRCTAALCAPLHSPSRCPAAAAPLSNVLPTTSLGSAVPPP
ncbi:hypothetical protein M422DRAFT_257542 [Sphaerobolus stellatus SS14]|uniref:Uncharacterized protein n=1 Tax=Sphaerobolus stellatus (strain SS14) TaxID=990650 RepID=A0A0C9VPD1_SPHS4|nr:hypothetical protein M422DRAFT_257542 [Sphaerobolus stellatus SS14]